jgi:hypothetical protein
MNEPVQEVAQNTDLMALVDAILLSLGVPPLFVGMGGGASLVILGAYLVYKLTVTRFVPWSEFNALRDRVGVLEGKTSGGD